MKQCKILIPILMTIFIVFGFFSIKYTLGNENVNFTEILETNNIETAEQWGEWTQTNLTYKDDGFIDYWAQPYETMVNGGGDCEDFAFLHVKVLHLLGYEAVALGMGGRKEREGHAICLFFDEVHWRVFDVQYLTFLKYFSQIHTHS